MSQKYDMNMQVGSPEREEILTRIRQRVREWDLALPEEEPLVMDFGLDDFWNTGLTEFWVANETEAGYCGKLLFLFDGQTCPAHHHELKHETFFVIKGEIEMRTGSTRIMRPGDRLVMEPGIRHR